MPLQWLHAAGPGRLAGLGRIDGHRDRRPPRPGPTWHGHSDRLSPASHRDSDSESVTVTTVTRAVTVAAKRGGRGAGGTSLAGLAAAASQAAAAG